MEQHFGSTFYSGARNTILRSEWWFIKKEWFDIRRSLLCRHFSFSTLLGEKDYLTSPTTVCIGGYAKGSTVFFFINRHSDLKMVTSPVKLCLLPTYTSSSLRFQLHVSIKGGVMKASCFNQGGVVKTRQTSVYFPLLPGSTGTNVFHFNMISLLISNVAPLSGLPMRFPWRGCAHFLRTTFDAGDHATNN